VTSVSTHTWLCESATGIGDWNGEITSISSLEKLWPKVLTAFSVQAQLLSPLNFFFFFVVPLNFFLINTSYDFL